MVGLYLNPPDNALVLCVDEKSQCQALERTQPMLPMGLGYVEGVTHDYVATARPRCSRRSTCSTARCSPSAGRAIGIRSSWLPAHHRSRRCRPSSTIHCIVDNYATTTIRRCGLAGRAAALAHALRSDLQLVAQPGRALLRPDHRQGDPARLVRSVKDLINKIDHSSPLQQELQAIHLDCHQPIQYSRSLQRLCSPYQRDSTLAAAADQPEQPLLRAQRRTLAERV